MSIKYRSTKEPALAAATGAAIGKAEAKKREQEIDWQRESEIRANQLKMQLQEQEIVQQFVNDQRRQQIAIDREMRAHEWESEKMELRSRMDFEEEEKERQKANAEFMNQLTEIDKQAAERGWDEDNPNVVEQKIQAALRVKQHNILKANQILGEAELREQERKRNEAALIRKEVAAYIGQELANLLPLDKGIEEMNKVKARLGEQPAAPSMSAMPAATQYGVQNIPTQNMPATHPAPTTEEEYNALPAGTRYLHPDGTIKVKG